MTDMNKSGVSAYFRNLQVKLEAAGERSRKIDQGFDVNAGKISRAIWPINEAWLVVVAGFILTGDFSSTYFALEIRHNPYIRESGPLAGWALATGGFPLLLVIDVVSVGIFCLAAFLGRYLYSRSGYPGYGRAAFLLFLVPYIMWTAFVVVNNTILGLLACVIG